jgi:glycosyltransferase involved in cell wall biosynthesis
MRVALISPYSVGPARGNITTVRRIADHLPETGCQVDLIPLDTLDFPEQQEMVNRQRPRLLHAFHAFHGGPVAQELARSLGIPYLITITGSDLFDPAMRDDHGTRRAIAAAAAVTCFDPLVARRLTELFPDVSGRVAIIPQGVDPLGVSEPFSRLADEFLILLPAALRPVKGVVEAVAALTPLAREFPFLRLLLAGGALDPEYARTVGEMAAALPWVRLLGDVPHQRMGALYATADLVLNCSFFEGGMANSLLEAMVMARPVAARDVPGNRSLVRHGSTGWLYGNDDELREVVRLLLADPAGRRDVAERGRGYVLRRCSSSLEARRYARVYGRIVGGDKPLGGTDRGEMKTGGCYG